MSKLIFTKGLQGSGKSTWAVKFCTDNYDWVRVSRDALRWMRSDKYWIPKQEDMITDMEDACIRTALRHGKNVIVDAMNLNDGRTKHRVKVLKEEFPELTHTIKDFTHVPLEECIKNDLKRPNSIGEKVIRDTYNKYFRTIPKIEYDPLLPTCIIVDIDGTLAQMNRNPYDWDRVGEDVVNKPVRDLTHRYINTSAVILMSGRDGICRKATEEWLNYNYVRYTHLYMRPEGNGEKDSIIKERLYKEHIEGKYNVLMVIDDRLQVCRTWFNLGLPLFRVGDPDADF